MSDMVKPAVKKFAIATVASGVAMWAIAGVWHEVIMASLYEPTHAEHEGVAILFVAYLVLGAFMAYLYPKGFRNGGVIKGGFFFGAIIGLLWVFPHGLAMSGAHGAKIAYVLKNSAWHMVEQGLGGIVVAWVYRRG